MSIDQYKLHARMVFRVLVLRLFVVYVLWSNCILGVDFIFFCFGAW